MDTDVTPGKRRAGAMRRPGLVLALAFGLIACQGGTTTTAQPTGVQTAQPTVAPTDDALTALYAAAREEGAFQVWGNAPPEYMTALFTAFKAAYPGIEPTYVQQSADDAVQAVLVEVELGQKPPTDLLLGRFQAMRPLYDKAAIVTDAPWVSYGVSDDVVMPVGGVVETLQPFGLAYNTTLLEAAALPSSWEALVDAKWDGKLSLDSSGVPWDFASAQWGQEKAVDFVNRVVAATHPVLLRGSTNGLLSLTSGETSIRAENFSEVQALQATGAPVAWVPMDEVIVSLTSWWLTANSDHPNAASLFVAWQTTAESQEIAHTFFRSNVLPAEVPATATILGPNTAAEYDVVAGSTTALRAILGQ